LIFDQMPMPEGEDIHVPFDQAAEAAAEMLEEVGASSVVFQVFECGHCGKTVQTAEPNAFHEHGRCYGCKKTTDLRATGCGFVVAVGDPDTIINAAADDLCGKPKGTA